MILYINSTHPNSVTYSLDGKARTYSVDPHESHETLAKLKEFLHASKIVNPQSDITKIVVNKGPGSYTGTRVGVTHALALGFSWHVPVQALADDLYNKKLQKLYGT